MAYDLEPNQSFASRQMIPAELPGSGPIVVEGAMDAMSPETIDFVASGALASGRVNNHIFFPVPPAAPFVALTDNTTGSGSPDIMMQYITRSRNQLAFNDDSSPLGNGLASAFSSSVGTDGVIRLEITGFPDFSFNGSHSQNGNYTLYVQVITGPRGDVDFYGFTGLVPGREFAADLAFAQFDTVIHWINDAGAIIASDDNGGEGNFSRLMGVVPASGVVNLAVTGVSDLTAVGNHSESGEYALVLTQIEIPEPAAACLALLGLGLASGIFGARRGN